MFLLSPWVHINFAFSSVIRSYSMSKEREINTKYRSNYELAFQEE